MYQLAMKAPPSCRSFQEREPSDVVRIPSSRNSSNSSRGSNGSQSSQGSQVTRVGGWRLEVRRPYDGLSARRRSQYHDLVDKGMYYLCQLHQMDRVLAESGEEPFLPRFPPSIARFLEEESLDFEPPCIARKRREGRLSGEDSLEDPLFLFLEALSICDQSVTLHAVLACLLAQQDRK
jgi:hypothetical protein